METELKLAFASKEDMDRLWKDPVFSSFVIPESEKEELCETVYYDSDHHLLREKGASLRVRAIRDNGYIHTIKCKADVKSGLHQRYEWNWETDESVFSAKAFGEHAISNGDPESILYGLLKEIRDIELAELFRTVFSRISFLTGYGDSLLEIAIDYGVIRANDQEDSICEMEIELKEGDVRDVIALGDEILSHSSAVLNSRSKYSRGFDLLKKV